VKRLPGPVRWLWFGILALIAVELALLALGLARGGFWLASATQLMSLTAAPLAIGVVIVVLAGRWSGRSAPQPTQRRGDVPAPSAGPAPRPEPPPVAAQDARPAPGAGTAPEVAAIQRTSDAVIAMARTPQGRAAIQQGARLLRAGRAAMRPAPPEPGSGPPREGGPN
jgi:hypothetical protein